MLSQFDYSITSVDQKPKIKVCERNISYRLEQADTLSTYWIR